MEQTTYSIFPAGTTLTVGDDTRKLGARQVAYLEIKSPIAIGDLILTATSLFKGLNATDLYIALPYTDGFTFDPESGCPFLFRGEICGFEELNDLLHTSFTAIEKAGK